MRSLLFVPAHKEDLIKKALDTKADAIIFDLEDSCPENQRRSAIDNINIFATQTSKKTIVRISGYQDISYILDVDYIMHPKAENFVKVVGRDWNKFPAILLIESAMGILNLYGMLEMWPIVKGVAFGNEDYFADTGCSDYSFAQHTIINHARAFNKVAIDTVFIGVHNKLGLRYSCLRAYNMGFNGKLCIHPSQVKIVNSEFTPSSQEYELAKKIIELSEKEKGVAILDGLFIAPPMVRRAKKVITKYEYYETRNDANRMEGN